MELPTQAKGWLEWAMASFLLSRMFPRLLGDFKQHTLVVTSADGGCSVNISVGVYGQGAVGKASVVAAGEVVEVGVRPTAVGWR
jgi:hypothetical protein